MRFEFYPSAKSRKTLIVVLHGVQGSPQKLRGVLDVIQRSDPEADILVPYLPYRGRFGIFAFARAEQIVCDVIAAITQRVDARANEQPPLPGYERLRLVGHSYGAVLARKIVILAHGETLEAPFEPAFDQCKQGLPWANRITRLVLLAGISRGWSPETARSWWLSLQWSVASLVGELLTPLLGRGPTVFAIRQGAPFIIQTRLQWLALVQSQTLTTRAPHLDSRLILVQALGTIDDHVSPADAVDQAIDLQDNAARFCFLEMPSTGHTNAIQMKLASDRQPTLSLPTTSAAVRAEIQQAAAGQGADADSLQVIRGCILGLAIAGDRTELDALAVPAHHLTDDSAPRPDPRVTRVVFVIHGIRDRGFWTHKIARAIKREWDQLDPPNPPTNPTDQPTLAYRSLTPSYGYFAMLPFVLPWIRRWKAAWLMERYTEAKARFPQAEFFYVGHSNGTYLVARALEDYPAARFTRIVFAGSVVRRRYDWQRLLRAGRVKGVLNYVATKDLVVALFPKGLQPLRLLFDLGSAGHDGFRTSAREVKQVNYVAGGHGAGIKEGQWDDIARFIAHGDEPPRERTRQSLVAVAGGMLSTLILVCLVATVVGIGAALFYGITGAAAATVPASARQLLTPLDGVAGAIGGVVGRVSSAVAPWLVGGAALLAPMTPDFVAGWLVSGRSLLNTFCLPSIWDWQIQFACMPAHDSAVTALWRGTWFALYCAFVYVVVTRV
jgi:pimeloyl-ACP methyl ester carboxylesterase